MDHMEDLNIWTFIKQGLIEREFLFLQQAISQGVLDQSKAAQRSIYAKSL